MIAIDDSLDPQALQPALENFWRLSAEKVRLIDREFDRSQGSPVFTVDGKYTTRGWTEWTQGFEFGSAILQFDATADEWMLEFGRQHTVGRMAPHLTHFGVHDHGFNNISTYGNLRRLMAEDRIPDHEWERHFYELALKVSGAVQAKRWTPIRGGGGFMYSFNGPHSLFVDTIRSCRALGVSHLLGHALMEECDERVPLLDRLLDHAEATARYSVYYGSGRDSYDERGRVAHESIFNTNDGRFRCPNAQQGFSGFTTWTRGLAWAVLGFAEQLEFLGALPAFSRRERVRDILMKAARATADFYIERAAAADGIPYWDTGAPNLHRLGADAFDRPAEPLNPHEPVDSSAAAIACQGLLRLGEVLGTDGADGRRYRQAGLAALRTLLAPPYLSESPSHHGLILHSVYHRPGGWDRIPDGAEVPAGESSMWGDYHAREAALLAQRLGASSGLRWFRFFDVGADLHAAV